LLHRERRLVARNAEDRSAAVGSDLVRCGHAFRADILSF
jgi:hypothetical protein